eukprot:TRINITY_DN13411_c0_g1_i1.p1 TRINITY_DN13411_c0_g1~~TRINITY_DN13411_c0_g1_i1.p1  ORF type:complete len:212 (+),score=55.12 TRINITY_DN13411_c0_g1_i1:82-717(+)
MGGLCSAPKPKRKCKALAKDSLLQKKKLDANGDVVITMGGGDAGNQGDTMNCCIYALNNALEDYLRCVHGLQYDAKAGVKMIIAKNYPAFPEDGIFGSIAENGTSLEDLVPQMNASKLEYPLLDGSKVTFEIFFDGEDGLEKAEPGNVVLVHMRAEEEGANHYMELEKVENGVATFQNSEDGLNHIKCPSNDFDVVLCNHKITTSEPKVVE